MLKKILCFSFSVFVGMTTVKEGFSLTLHVVDWTNLAKNISILDENIKQTKLNSQKYSEMLKQTEVLMKNISKPNRYFFDDIQATINNIKAAKNSISSYKKKLGGIQAFLKKYKNLKDYEQLDPTSPGYKKLVEEHKEFTKTVTMETNNDLLSAISEQQDDFEKEAETLKELQSTIKKAEGNLEAVSHTNQILAHQTNQIMKLRSAYLSKQAADSVKEKEKDDERARQDAELKRMFTIKRVEPYDGETYWGKF